MVVDKRMTEIGKTGLRGKCANETAEKEDELRGRHYKFKNESIKHLNTNQCFYYKPNKGKA
jgi:hypothetical protein